MIEDIKKRILFYFCFEDIYNYPIISKEYLRRFNEMEKNLVNKIITKNYNLKILKYDNCITIKAKTEAITISSNPIRWKQIAKLSKKMYTDTNTNADTK